VVAHAIMISAFAYTTTPERQDLVLETVARMDNPIATPATITPVISVRRRTGDRCFY